MSVPGDPRDGGQQRSSQPYAQNPAEAEPGHRPGAGYGGPLARPRNGFGVAALVLGLLALLLCWTIIGGIVFGILALIFGLLGRKRANRGEATNGGMSVVGAVIGTIGLVIAIGLIVLGISLFNTPAGQSYQRCIQEAQGAPATLQRCLEEFAGKIGR